MSKEKNSKQMSLLEDSPANRSVSQVNKKEEMTTDISGQKCLDSLKKSNPSSLLERMCRDLLTSKTAWSSDRCKMTWKVKVSKSNVSLYQLQASVLGTKDLESGLWATPNTMDYLPPRSAAGTKKLMEGHRKGRTKPSNLREQVDPETMKMYPTPTSQDHSRNTVPPSIGKTRGMDLSMRVVADEIQKQKKMYPTPNARDWKDTMNTVPPSVGKTRGHSLGQRIAADQVRMYPTPRSSGQEDAETLIKRKGEKAASQHNLTAHMQMFPTPSANEQQYRLKGDSQASKCLEAMARRGEIMWPTPSASCQMDVVAPPETVKKNSSGWSVTRVGTGTKFGAKLNDVVNKVNQPIKPGGKLNPTFVEFLMGFPENWTRLEQAESKVSETQSSHKWQESSDSQSKKFYPTPRANEPGRTTKGYGRGLAELMEGKKQREPKK